MKSKKQKGSEEERTRLLEAGWESRLRGGLIVWRRPGGREDTKPKEEHDQLRCRFL
jgi:hypothetical protein